MPQEADFTVVSKLFLKFVWDVRDKKVDGWLLMDSLLLNLVLSVVYLIFVAWLGPKIMLNRKAFDLHYIFVSFLFGLFLMNFVIHVEFWASGWATGYKAACENLDRNVNEQSLKMAKVCWWYFISKYVDCFYTVFNILKKRFYKVTFQQVLHHTSMIINSWCLVRFFPGGHMTFVGLANTFSHAVLYVYYATSNMNPNCRYRRAFSKLAIWINFIELFIISAYLLLPYFLRCNYSGIVVTYTVSTVTLYILLFLQGILFKNSANQLEYNKIDAFDVNDI